PMMPAAMLAQLAINRPGHAHLVVPWPVTRAGRVLCRIQYTSSVRLQSLQGIGQFPVGDGGKMLKSALDRRQSRFQQIEAIVQAAVRQGGMDACTAIRKKIGFAAQAACPLDMQQSIKI